MGKSVTLAIALCLGVCAAAHAQQTGGSQAGGSMLGGGLGSSTPGGSDYGRTRKIAPAAQQPSTIPGGGIPMGAATQGAPDLPSDPSNFDDGRGSKQR